MLTSVGTTSAESGLAPTASATVSPSSRARRPATATSHPAPSRLLAIHRPRPDPAPVTTATPARAVVVIAVGRSVARSSRLAVWPAVLRAGARAWRDRAETLDHGGQYGLEDGIVGHAGELVPHLPDVRVLATVDSEVAPSPAREVGLLLAGIEGQERSLSPCPGEGEVADRAVSRDRSRALEAGLEHRSDKNIDNSHLSRLGRRPCRGQRRGGRVSAVGRPQSPC